MFYSAATGGFYLSDSNSQELVEITSEEHSSLLAGQSTGMAIVPDNNGYPVLSEPAVVLYVPVKVTMRQARLALLQAGLLSQVEDAINALPEPPRTAARIEWDFSSEVFRDREFVIMLGNTLGLDDEEMDSLFITAATL